MAQYITQHRRGTKEEWINSKETPYEAELVVELDEVASQHKLKIGDGITPYEDLGYLQAGGTDVTQAVARQATVTLYVDDWVQHTDNRWYQTVEVVGTTVTARDKVDLQLSEEQLDKGLAFVTKNRNGTVEVCCVGRVPQSDYTIQATALEVLEVTGDCIIGDTIATPNPQPDWAQTDESKADFIKNKITKISELENDVDFNGLSMWVATIAYEGGTAINKTYISVVEGREIQVGDLILYTNNIVCRVTQLGTNSVVVEETGIDFSGVSEERVTTLEDDVAEIQNKIDPLKFEYCLLEVVDDIDEYAPETGKEISRINGQSVERAMIYWGFNKVPSKVWVDRLDASGGIVEHYTITEPELSGSYTFNNITENTKWCISPFEEGSSGSSAPAEASIIFYDVVYYGKAPIPESYDDNFKSSLGMSKFNSDKIIFNGEDGDEYYCWYCTPYGRHSFKFNGMEGGFILAGTASFTNSYGYTTEYDIYRSVNPNLGDITVTKGDMI